MARVKQPARIARAKARADRAAARGREWVDQQEPSSRKGVAIGVWQRYRAVEGPLQSALLSAYFLVAVVPALLVVEEYLERSPSALARHLIQHYGLSTQTGILLRGVLTQDKTHELGSALMAIAGSLIFGLGFGKVLQSVHARAWGIPLRPSPADQARYAYVLCGIYGLTVLLLFQLNKLSGAPSWVGRATAPGWLALVVLFFLWVPRLLLHKQVSRRDLLPGAVLTALGIVLLIWVSGYVMEPWLNLYAKDYGGFGVVVAAFFWLGFLSAVIIWAAALAPALAVRRTARASARPAP